jgi:site-specific recombinase XerD
MLWGSSDTHPPLENTAKETRPAPPLLPINWRKLFVPCGLLTPSRSIGGSGGAAVRNYVDAWERFERVVRGRPAASVAFYQCKVAEFIAWLEASARAAAPADVTRADVTAYLEHLYFDLYNSNPTRAQKLTAVRSYFRYLGTVGLIAADPTKDIPSPRLQVHAPRKFTTDQLRKLFSAPDLSKPQGVRDRAMLMTLYGAGLRKSELCELDLSAVVVTGSHITLTVHGKGGKERTLTLKRRPATALALWLTHRVTIEAADKALFVALKGPRKRLDSRHVTTVLKKYARVVGIPQAEAFVHKLRATWATDLYDSGVEVMEICALAGWSDVNTARRYIRISEKVLKKAAIPDRRWREIERCGQEGAA